MSLSEKMSLQPWEKSKKEGEVWSLGCFEGQMSTSLVSVTVLADIHQATAVVQCCLFLISKTQFGE